MQLLRLTSSGKNALDFTLAYYVGRAVAADPTGCFHIISKDAGYDPLIKHLRTRHISVRRHDSFATLTFQGPAKPEVPIPPAAAPKPKPPSKPNAKSATLDERETRVLEHFRSHPATRPRTQKTLVRFLVPFLRHKITEPDALSLVEYLGQGGHLVIGDKGKVTYHLEPK